MISCASTGAKTKVGEAGVVTVIDENVRLAVTVSCDVRGASVEPYPFHIPMHQIKIVQVL